LRTTQQTGSSSDFKFLEQADGVDVSGRDGGRGGKKVITTRESEGALAEGFLVRGRGGEWFRRERRGAVDQGGFFGPRRRLVRRR